MTTQEFIKKQHEKIEKLKTGIPIAIAAQDTHVKMVERIFENGKDANGGKIGEYNDSDPIYVNPKNAPRNFPKKGKTGKVKFANGKDHKTGYFESYKEFRQKQGRQTSFVDLKLFGNLNSDFGKGVVKIGDLKYVSTVTNEANEGKIKGAEAKFGSIFKLTDKERENFKEVMEFETFKILK